MMNYFSMPADFQKNTIDQYQALNDIYPDAKVHETYGQLTEGFFLGSGRSYGLLPKAGLKQLEEYIQYSDQKGIAFHYTFNTTCMGNREFTEQGFQEITMFLSALENIGVTSITVAQPSLIELIRLKNYHFKIKASTLCNINTMNKAHMFRRTGVDKIVVQESINRDFQLLKEMQETAGCPIELIANVICHNDCIYRTFHYNFTSHDLNEDLLQGVSSYYSHRCIMQRCADVSNLLKITWIRPEDIPYYNDIGIHYFKLQGRQAVLTGSPVKTAEAYMRQSYEGGLFDLLDLFSPTNSFSVYVDNKKLDGYIKPFAEIPYFCRNNCNACGYCTKFIRTVIEVDKAESQYANAVNFYQMYDQFIRTCSEAGADRMDRPGPDR